MPNAAFASIDFLADIDLYHHEKPFVALVAPGVKVRDEDLNNLQWEPHEISIDDVRGEEPKFGIDECGFQFVKDPKPDLNFTVAEDIEKYKQHTQTFLKGFFGALRVHCWETRVRLSSRSFALPSH